MVSCVRTMLAVKAAFRSLSTVTYRTKRQHLETQVSSHLRRAYAGFGIERAMTHGRRISLTTWVALAGLKHTPNSSDDWPYSVCSAGTTTWSGVKAAYLPAMNGRRAETKPDEATER